MYGESVDLDFWIDGTPEQLDGVLMAYAMERGDKPFFVIYGEDGDRLYWRALNEEFDDAYRAVLVWTRLIKYAKLMNLNHNFKMTRRPG